MFMIEQGSVDHNIHIVLHFSEGMVVIIDIHFNSFPKCLDNQPFIGLIQINLKCVTFREWKNSYP